MGEPKMPLQYNMQGRRFSRCQADDDDHCVHRNCPQLRDGEPKKTGRHCPLDIEEDRHG